MTSISLPILAAWLTPSLFYGGMAAVSLPILIHILARRRFRRIRWAAMDFLLDAERRNRRRLRLEEWILLALRCLAVALLGVLVARPFFTPKSAAALWGGSRRTERVFVLDDSMSMGYESAAGSTFSKAKIAVRRLIEAVRKQAPDDTVTLIRMTSADRPVESSVFLDDAQTESLLARLEALAPTHRAVDASTVVAGVADVLNRGKDLLNAVVYIIGDFQRNDWVAREAAPGTPATAANPLTSLTEWASDKKGLRIALINLGDASAANRALTDLRAAGGPYVAGTTASVTLELRNFSDAPIEQLPMSVVVGAVAQPTRTLPLLAGRQAASAELAVEFLLAGDETVRAEIPADGLAADDTRFAAVEVASAIRVLLVNGEQSGDSFEDETTYLATALRPEGDVFSGNEVTIIDESQLETERLGAYSVVVLANVYRVTETAVTALERFATAGGGVVFFLGDQVDAALYNSLLHRDGAGILPAKLIEPFRVDTEVHLVIKDRLHPMLAGVSREGDPLGIGRIPFLQFWSCELPIPADPSTQPANGAVPPARDVRVVAAFDDAKEHPALLERLFGQGRVMLVATSADKEWHYWPDHPTFLPLMIELIRHCARSSGGGDEQVVGSAIALSVDPNEFEPDVIVRTPNYPNEQEAPITATPVENGEGLVAKWEQTDASGIYQFALRRRDGGETLRFVAANVDPRESDLSCAREDELRKAMPGVPFEYIQGLEQLPSATGDSRIEFWRPVLITLASLLMVESFLAWFWGRRR